MNRWMSSAVALLVLSAGLPALACLHGPASFTGRLGAENYVALVMHDGERETLILNVQLDVEGPPDASGERVPIDDALVGLGHVGWVIALPATPDLYSADVKPEIFAEAEKLVPKTPDEQGGVLTFSGADDPEAIEVRLVRAGPYLIHEVKAKGAGAVEGLNAWFAKNGYATKKPSEMSFFVERGYIFLCVRVDPAKAPPAEAPKPDANKPGRNKRGDEPSGNGGADKGPAKPGEKVPLDFGDDEDESPSGLPPLLVSFKSERPFIPLKFSSHQGVFSLQALTLTAAPIDWVSSRPVLKQLGVESPAELWFPACSNNQVEASAFKGELARVVTRLQAKGHLARRASWFLNNLVVDEINLDDRPISGWKTDVWLELDRDPARAELREALRAILRPWCDLDEPARKGLARARKLGAAALPALLRERLASPGHERRREFLLTLLTAEALSGELTAAQLEATRELLAVVEERSVGGAVGLQVEWAIIGLHLGREGAVEQAIRAMEGAAESGIEAHEAGLPGVTPEGRVKRILAALAARVAGAPKAPRAKGTARERARAHVAAWQSFAESLDEPPVFDPKTGRFQAKATARAPKDGE